MPARLLPFIMLLSLCSWLSGCLPTAEAPSAEHSNAHYRAGKERLAAFDYKGAIESFERALEDNPRSTLAHFELGVVFEQQEHDYASALYHYNKALRLRPNGYPSDNIRYRIPACRQELVKADSLATINPTLFNEIQTLRATNQWLLRELGIARVQLAARAANAPSESARNAVAGSSQTAGTAAGFSGPSSRTNQPAGAARTATASTRGARTYTVRAKDTAASISRQNGVRLDAFMSANPGLQPKRMRVGQVVNLPAS